MLDPTTTTTTTTKPAAQHERQDQRPAAALPPEVHLLPQYRAWRKERRRALLQELEEIEDQMRRDGELPGRPRNR